MSRSVLVQIVTPSGFCNAAEPLNCERSTLPETLNNGPPKSSVTTQLLVRLMPLPVDVCPPQQYLKSPVVEFHIRIELGFESSCTDTSKTVTENEQLAVFPDESVAVHVTVVTPGGSAVPDGGTHATVAPGQLS